MDSVRKTCITGKLPPPIGTSDWETFSRDSICVDKTLMVRDIVDLKTRVALFTRPRRFGKTTAMRMIRAFFEKRLDAKGERVDTSHLFADKRIWAEGEAYRALQGRFPIIWLSFKDHKSMNWEDALFDLRSTIGSECARHLESIRAMDAGLAKRSRLVDVANEESSPKELAESLGYLAEAVHSHWGAKPIVIIDEYDQPISSASTFGYYDQMCSFLRMFLSGAMKDNEHVEMGLMTGVLRVAKEGILSGLNNLKVYTVFDAAFSEYFGFTEDEVRGLAEYDGVPEKMAEIQAWYDGYDFAGTEIYNPWSVLYYFSCDCKPGPYWLDTSSNDLITELVATYPHDTKKVFQQLLQGGSPYVPMASELGPYARIKESPDTLYALLVSAGYLKVASPLEMGACAVSIPNHEIRQVFEMDIMTKLRRSIPVAFDITTALLTRDADALKAAIGRFLVESVSYFDAAAEGFFHGLTLGFLAILRDRFRVKSNAESGEGRFDIMLRPLVPDFPGYVVEVKAARSDGEDLKALAADALDQIERRDYVAELRAERIADIVKLGLAYRGKRVELAVG